MCSMSPILHFRKELTAPPVAAQAPGIYVREVQIPDDIVLWLALRDRAMESEAPGVRPWSPGDFRAEMIEKSWWRKDRSWIAKTDSSDLVGAVTLAIRSSENAAIPVVHWLLVDPAWRRRGIARLLVSNLEQAAWNDGWREVQLETHAGWHAAVAFYQSIGYAPLRERSPR
jgi:GNAT superfamily N-acetyltransferase